MLVFRLNYLGFQCSWQNKSFDCVFKREIGNTRQLTYTIPLPEKVNLGPFFHFEIDFNLLPFQREVDRGYFNACVRFYHI